MIPQKCPKCNSGHIDAVIVGEDKYLICLSCGYDESVEVLDTYPEERTKKGKVTPYKTGGARRTQRR